MFKAPLAAAACLMVLSACQLPIPGVNAPQAPADQALATECSGDAQAAARLSSGVNAARLAEGKNELAVNDDLNRIALAHACDMAQTGRADVAGSNGSNVVDRARSVGYPTCGVVQLVGAGGTPEGTVGAWLAAGPQREQILGQLSYQVGSGAVQGPDGRMWLSTVLGNNCR
ncbi:CAP domain-containing protein [Paracoccus nototheniae]|uniref:CAP domain-containing protein n=1 Tax=Paracoccus nototheniae TaxID=2489002 RepID=A0ABW4DXU0_9RHOB|nr:CAP domain-containing protein [Paracoccus nototheniae]